jgi:hypothetical protein
MEIIRLREVTPAEARAIAAALLDVAATAGRDSS